jgi:hypothetical protein
METSSHIQIEPVTFNKPQPKPLVGEKTVCGRIVSRDKGEDKKVIG